MTFNELACCVDVFVLDEGQIAHRAEATRRLKGRNGRAMLAVKRLKYEFMLVDVVADACMAEKVQSVAVKKRAHGTQCTMRLLPAQLREGEALPGR